MTWSRRAVLAGGVALGCSPRPPALTGGIVGAELAGRGHRVLTPPPPGAPGGRVDVAIVGAGVAGCAAAWWLHRSGFRGTVGWYELADLPGGTSAWGSGPLGAYPWGAHYLVMPNREASSLRAMLTDLGVITGFDAEGRPFYDPAAVCLAPQERVFSYGRWDAGLVPAVGSPQLAAFEDEIATWRDRVGADGRPAFAIPVAEASRDPDILALHHQSFAEWLDRRGYDDPVLRWLLRYAVRDDFGTELATTSAWAGLHYHAARRPDPADARDLGTNVLTWPAGNGWLIAGLLGRVPWTPTYGAVVRAVSPSADRVDLWVEGREISAGHAILAVPGRVAARLLAREIQSPDHSPWRVAQLWTDRPPAGSGVPVAWDSVIHDGRGLGYVNNSHQSARYGGPAVLTYYDTPSHQPPSDGRRSLWESSWEEAVDHVLSDLSPAHPDLRERVSRIDVLHWGHGTARPIPGVDPSAFPLRPHPRVSLAHTDRSGISLFEEAAYHGVRAASEALAPG